MTDTVTERPEQITVALDWWPADGAEGTLKTVAFGPISSAVRVLLELTIDPDTDGEQLTITVGNGYADEQSPAGRLRATAELLGDLAQLITATADVAAAPTPEETA